MKLISLYSTTDSEGIEVDIVGLPADVLKRKRKYRKRTHLSVSQRKDFKKYVPPLHVPTVEFKIHTSKFIFERRKNEEVKSHSLQFSCQPQQVDLLDTPNVPQVAVQSSADDAKTDYYSDGDVSSTPSHYVQSCIRELAQSDILTKVLWKCEQKGPN